jgi:hypothetical protein
MRSKQLHPLMTHTQCRLLHSYKAEIIQLQRACQKEEVHIIHASQTSYART